MATTHATATPPRTATAALLSTFSLDEEVVVTLSRAAMGDCSRTLAALVKVLAMVGEAEGELWYFLGLGLGLTGPASAKAKRQNVKSKKNVEYFMIGCEVVKYSKSKNKTFFIVMGCQTNRISRNVAWGRGSKRG
jgi:hypothetical protein